MIKRFAALTLILACCLTAGAQPMEKDPPPLPPGPPGGPVDASPPPPGNYGGYGPRGYEGGYGGFRPMRPESPEMTIVSLLAHGRLEEARKVYQDFMKKHVGEGAAKEAFEGYRMEKSEVERIEFLGAEVERALRDTEGMRPEEKHEYLRGLAREIHELREMHLHGDEDIQEVLKIRETEREVWRLSREYEESEYEEEKEDLRKELRERLNALFDLRQAERKRKIEELREELKDLEESVKYLNDHRDQAIEKRLQQMTGEEDELLDW